MTLIPPHPAEGLWTEKRESLVIPNKDGECGQNNRLLELAGHITQDGAFQEIVNRPSRSGHTQNNQMAPQTFRMDDLMREIDSETFRIPMTTNQFGNGIGATEYHWADPWENTASRYPSYNYDLPNQPIYYPDCLRQSHSEQPLNNEELLKLQKEIEEAKKEYLEASLNESTANQLDVKTVEGKSEDKENVLKQGEIWSNPLMFNNFINDYVHKGTQWKKNQQHIAETFTSKYQSIRGKTLPTIKDLVQRGVSEFNERNFSQAALWFKEAYLQDPKSHCAITMLFESLCIANGDPDELIIVAKEFFKLTPDDHQPHISFKHIYYLKNYPYQTCQMMVNWLKNQKELCDIIPLNFEIEDKNTTEVDDELLKSLKKMFIKAAQRNPYNPNVTVQYWLAVLCELSREYDKAADCQRIVASRGGILNHIKIQLGMYLFFANKPLEAIKVFNEVAELKNKDSFEAYIKIGCTYMYLKDYEKAVESFNQGYNISSGENIQVVNAWLATCHDLLGKQ